MSPSPSDRPDRECDQRDTRQQRTADRRRCRHADDFRSCSHADRPRPDGAIASPGANDRQRRLRGGGASRHKSDTLGSEVAPESEQRPLSGGRRWTTPRRSVLWLRRRRMALGLTHAALAECAHCSVSALRKIEGDERRPSHRLAERLATCLQFDRCRAGEPGRDRARRAARRPAARVSCTSPLPAPVGHSNFDATTPSIAVLPFVNLSDDAANEHFADGLAEELLNVLAKIPGLRVASRTSAFSFKGSKDIDVRDAGAQAERRDRARGQRAQGGQARAHHGASSSRRRAIRTCGRSRTTASWTTSSPCRTTSRARSCRSCDRRCWASSADAAASARVQAQVSRRHAAAPRAAQAHELYLLGRFLVDRFTPDDTTTAIGYYRQALQLDPRYALAWAGPGGRVFQPGRTTAGRRWHRRSNWPASAARHAVELEPELPEAHAELGWVQMSYQWDWHAADASYARALDAGRRRSQHRQRRVGAGRQPGTKGRGGGAGAARGRTRPAQLHRARQPGAAVPELGPAGARRTRRSIRRSSSIRAPRCCSPCSVRCGSSRDGSRRRCGIPAGGHRAIAPRGNRDGTTRARATRVDSEATLRELIDRCAGDGALQIAEAFAYRGDADLAFEWLERAYLQRDSGLAADAVVAAAAQPA